MKAEIGFVGRAFVDGELRKTKIGVAGGKIVSLDGDVEAERVVDVGDRIMLPGFVDPHVHFRDPGMTEKEDFGTGTLSAVYAGVTCVYDMPNTLPPVTDIDSLRRKKSQILGKANVDYGLFAAVTEKIDAEKLAPHVVGFKLFMGSTTGNILLNGEEMIPSVSKALATGRRVSVHAEDDSLIVSGKEDDCRDHLRNRPAVAEFTAISRLASAFSGKAINICHITTPEGMDLAHANGFTAESTLHHVLFDVDTRTSAEFKVNPPIRDSATRKKLYERFVSGVPDMVGTDHAPHTVQEKSRGFSDAPSGIPGVETTVPIVMNMVRTGDMAMTDAVRMASRNPADLFSVPKGRLAVGYDADISVFDMRPVRIETRKLHSKCGHSPYEGYEAVFPREVYVRGRLQIREGEFCGDAVGEDVRGNRLFGGGGKEDRVHSGMRNVLSVPA